MNLSYKHTVAASYIGFFVQAVVNCFIPLLFVTFSQQFGFSLAEISALITLNFAIQLVTDLFASRYADKIGYRRCIVASQLFAVIGIGGLSVFPFVFQSPYVGVALSVVSYAVGGGLCEVLLSPIVEACPTSRKDVTMMILHSCYCWGVAICTLISVIYFRFVGIENWRYLAAAWAVLPLVNGVYFSFVPIYPIIEQGSEGLGVRGLLKCREFGIMMLLMLAAGASELSISQWVSAYAEKALGVSKAVGDLAGPCAFAILMGSARVGYAFVRGKISIENILLGGGILCVIGYVLASCSGSAVLGLVGCGICGIAVAMMWPGTLNIASARIPLGGTTMFGLFALAGDLGCSSGPSIVGVVSGIFEDNLKIGLLAAVVFPAMMCVGVLLLKLKEKRDLQTK